MDAFRRRHVGPDAYQCGCRWERRPVFGDVLVECPIHAAAGRARLRKFERDAGDPRAERNEEGP